MPVSERYLRNMLAGRDVEAPEMQCDCELDEIARGGPDKICQAHFALLEQKVLAEREACAKVAEAKAVDFLSPEYASGQPLSSFSERFACKQIAEAIRARAT